MWSLSLWWVSVEEFKEYDSVVVFSGRACVYSKIFPDIPLVGPKNDVWNLKKKFIDFFFRENCVQSFWGWGTFSSSPSWGLPSPIWPLQILVLGTLIKMVFRGDRPHSGEIWGLASVHFDPLFLEIQLTDFGIFNLIDSTYSLLSILSCVTEINFVEIWKKREKSLFGVRKAKIF